MQSDSFNPGRWKANLNPHLSSSRQPPQSLEEHATVDAEPEPMLSNMNMMIFLFLWGEGKLCRAESQTKGEGIVTLAVSVADHAVAH